MVSVKRKVVQHGPSSLIVSLPKEWTDKCQIKKGDEIHLDVQDYVLFITHHGKSAHKETVLDVSSLDRTSILYAIRGAYRHGYDVVRVQFTNQETKYYRTQANVFVIGTIKNEVNRLIGYEIIEEGKNHCVIKDVQETSARDFDTMLRRIFLLIKQQYEAFRKSAIDLDKTQYALVEDYHENITKLVSCCMRILSKKNHTDPEKTSYYYHIIAYLDRISDVIKYAARIAKKEDKKISTEAANILLLAEKNIAMYYDFFYSEKLTLLEPLNKNRYLAEEILESLDSQKKSKEIIICTKLIGLLEMILDLVEAKIALR